MNLGDAIVILLEETIESEDPQVQRARKRLAQRSEVLMKKRERLASRRRDAVPNGGSID
jgi:hypothetical protein